MAGTLLATTGVALGTRIGREIVVGVGLRFANRQLDGSLAVDSVTGSIVDGLTAHNVKLVGRDTVPFATVAALSVRYRIRDLLSRRIVLGQVVLDRPTVNVIQDSAGRFNFQKIFRLGGPPGGTRPLIAFRDVTIDSAQVSISTRATPGDTARPERLPEIVNGQEIRRIQNLSGRFSYVRLSSPFPGEKPLRVDVASLKARVSDPRLVIRDAQGRLDLEGDTVRLDLPSLAIGSSRASASGLLHWPRDTIMTELAVRTRDAVLDDIRSIVPAIPKGLEGTGTFVVTSLAGDITSISSDNLRLQGRRNGGTVTGAATMVLGPRSTWSVKRTALTVENFDLEYVRGFFDTLPVAGRLTGTAAIDGPRDHLDVTAAVTFRDSLVPGWPRTYLEGEGVMTVAEPAGVIFQDFSVRQADVDLATVRRLMPAVPLQGMLYAQGRLRGPWLELEFNGDLRQVDEPYPETLARGSIQVDATGDTLGVWGNLELDSLHLPGLWSSYPSLQTLPLVGAFAGRVRVEGYLDAMHLVADIAGPPGRITGEGTLGFEGAGFAAHDMDFRFRELDVRALVIEPIGTSLNGRLRGSVVLDSTTAPAASLQVALDSSRVGGTLVDSAWTLMTMADSAWRFDSLVAYARAAQLRARGGIGLGSRPDSIRVTAALDSLGVLEPLLASSLELAEDTARRPLSGRVAAQFVVAGTLSDFRVTVAGELPLAQWGPLHAERGRLRGLWSSTERGRAQGSLTLDSLAYGALAFSGLDAAAAGQRDSVGWWVRGRNGAEASVTLAGSAMADSAALRVPLDSARLVLPTMTWTLQRPTTVVWGDSAIDVGVLTLLGADTGSRVALEGSLPMAGHGRLTVTLQDLAMRDLLAALQRETQAAGGVLNGTIDIAGTARSPQMHSELDIANAVYGDFRMARIEGIVDYAARRLQGAFTLRNQGSVVMGVTADLPIDLAIQGVAANRQIPGELTIRAIADSVDLAILEAVSSGITNASGLLEGDFGIVGSWDSPQLNGQLVIRNGAVSYPGAGVRHQNIQGRFAMSGDTLAIEQLGLRSGQGTLSASGFLRLQRLTNPVFQVHLSARDFFTLDVRNLATATVTGEFDLRGPILGATLTGSGTVPNGTLHFADLLYKRVLNLEDTLLSDVVDTAAIRRQGLTRSFQNRFIDSLNVDSLRVDMGDEVWLRSTEANIQLAGNVIFSKTGAVYRAAGVLTTTRGTYQLRLGFQGLTRQFQVTRGEIRMLGTPDLNGLVDIDAQHVVHRRTGENINVFVHIGGTLYVPTITLSSDIRPAIPETEIVSYLLFGGPLASVGATGGQAAVQAALSSLGGQLENMLLSNLGLPFAFDYLQISPSYSTGQGNPLAGSQLLVGWQVDFFGFPAWVTPSFGLGSCARQRGLTGVTIDFRLSSEFRLGFGVEPPRQCSPSSQTGNNRQAGVDLRWEKNY